MQTGDPDNIPTWLVILVVPLVLVIFAVVWLLITTLLANLSGWVGLARAFRAGSPPVGRSFGFGSGRIGMVNFRNCLTLTVGDKGFQLSIWPLFRGLATPDLFIPYAAISNIEERKILFLSYPAILLRDHATVIAIHGEAGNAIKAAWAKSSAHGGR
jgi:hypothetical protein